MFGRNGASEVGAAAEIGAPGGGVAAECVEVDGARQAVDGAAVGVLPEAPVGIVERRVGEGADPQLVVGKASAQEAQVARLVAVEDHAIAPCPQVVAHGCELFHHFCRRAGLAVGPLLDVDGQRQVDVAVGQGAQHVGRLSPSLAVEAEEVVGAHGQSGLSGAAVVVGKGGVGEAFALAGLDVDKADAVGSGAAEVDAAVVGRDIDALDGIERAVGVEVVDSWPQQAGKPVPNMAMAATATMAIAVSRALLSVRAML